MPITSLLFIILFVVASLFYLAAAVVCLRRSDRLGWTRLGTGIGFALMAVGSLARDDTPGNLVFVGAVLVFISAILTAVLTARRARQSG